MNNWFIFENKTDGFKFGFGTIEEANQVLETVLETMNRNTWRLC